MREAVASSASCGGQWGSGAADDGDAEAAAVRDAVNGQRCRKGPLGGLGTLPDRRDRDEHVSEVAAALLR
jgi:hypothetical protein